MKSKSIGRLRRWRIRRWFLKLSLPTARTTATAMPMTMIMITITLKMHDGADNTEMHTKKSQECWNQSQKVKSSQLAGVGVQELHTTATTIITIIIMAIMIETNDPTAQSPAAAQ